MAEGFLDIMGVTAPSGAHEGDIVNFTTHVKNIGATDNFRVEFFKNGVMFGTSEFSLSAGLIEDLPFLFFMPNTDVSIAINTFHWFEEVGWVWDTSSVWEILFPFMNIKDRPFKQ